MENTKTPIKELITICKQHKIKTAGRTKSQIIREINGFTDVSYNQLPTQLANVSLINTSFSNI